MPMPDQATLRNRVKIAVARSIQISSYLAPRWGIEATPVFWRRVVARRVMSPAKYWGVEPNSSGLGSTYPRHLRLNRRLLTSHARTKLRRISYVA